MYAYYRTFVDTANPANYPQLQLSQLYGNEPVSLTYAEPAQTYTRTCTVKETTESPDQRATQPATGVGAPAFTAEPKQFHTFYIPKRTGGMRRIDAPAEDYKNALAAIAKRLDYMLVHNAAHAYVPKRSTLTALTYHQQNESKWFLKMDLKDFFPSHTAPYMQSMLYKLRCPGTTQPDWRAITEYAVMENGQLPQGSPLSPLLTNLCCIPMDYELTRALGPSYRYTRYADDLLISSRVKFDSNKVVQIIQRVLNEHAPALRINHEKTRFGSCAGRNWNLGLMYNKDQAITIGHSKKERIRASVNNFLHDFTQGRFWSIMDAQVMRGHLEYYKHIEPEQATALITKYSQKYHTDFYTAYKQTVTR